MIHRFGPFQYDSEQRLLFRGGETVQLMPKAIDTLHVLVERRGRVVEKAELMKLVWPDTVVEEVGLARNVSLLRKALGDEAAESPYIETIPRRGYRFVAAEVLPPVTPVVGRKRWRPVAWLAAIVALTGLLYWQFYVPSRFLKRGPGMASLAVVPFEPLSGDANRSGFAHGITDSLVSGLSELDGVQVVSPSTVRRHQWAGISMGLMGRLLGLDVLVEGSVRQVGDRLHITARLVDVHTGKVIWSATYDRSAANTGEMEASVAAEVAAQVGAHLAIHGEFSRTRQ
ncbi:MAG: winged helix-turn-helix domain-containing protein [Candidatus Solibacter sp.]